MRVKGNILADNLGLEFSDGSAVFEGGTHLAFNPFDFYLSKGNAGQSMVNFNDIRAFTGCMVQLEQNVPLTSGVPSILSFRPVMYDYGNWFNYSSSPTNFVVPAGVHLIVVTCRFNYLPTGTPNSTSRMTTTVLNNGAVIPAAGTSFISPAILLGGFSATTTFATGPLPVIPGDVITIQALSTWGTASAMNVQAATSYIAMYAIR